MFVLINCNTGVLNDESRVLGVYGTLDMAQRAMAEEVDRILCEFDDDPEDKCVGETHATTFLDLAVSPEWHIFEVPGAFIPKEACDGFRKSIREAADMYGDEERNDWYDADDICQRVCWDLEGYLKEQR